MRRVLYVGVGGVRWVFLLTGLGVFGYIKRALVFGFTVSRWK